MILGNTSQTEDDVNLGSAAFGRRFSQFDRQAPDQ